MQDLVPVQKDFKDSDALWKEAIEGAQWGFAGKQVIHPAQVDPVQRAFSPDDDRVKEARELVDAFEEHQKSGVGAFSFKGQMIDNPTVLVAQNLLALAEP